MVEAEFRDLKEHERAIMLDLILVWAKIDVSLGYFASCFFPESEVSEVAQVIGKRRASSKLHGIIGLIQQTSSESHDLLQRLKKSKKQLERHSVTRDLVAHGKCIGCRNDDTEYVGFLKFEKVGDNQLAMYQVPLEEFQRATTWGTHFDAWLAKMIYAAKRG